MDEVTHFTKNVKHYLKRVYSGQGPLMIDGTDYAHTVIRITMKNGEVYAFDMTGAQYGWDECITPWNLYSNSRIRELMEIVPFGETKVRYKMKANNTGGQSKWIRQIKDCFARYVECAMTLWQRDNISMTSLLRLPEAEFQRKQAYLLDAVEDAMQRTKAILESHGGLEVKAGFKPWIPDRKFTSVTPGFIP